MNHAIFVGNFSIQFYCIVSCFNKEKKKKKKAAEAFHRKQDIAMRQMTELKVTKIKY